MGGFLSVAGPVVILVVMVLGGAAISKGLFSAGHTPDGDTVRNRLEGRGPNDQPMGAPQHTEPDDGEEPWRS